MTAWVLLTTISVLIFVIGILLSRNMTGPIVYEDGLGYLANARHLAGTRISPDLAPMSFYYPGYSLLILSLYLLPIGPESVYQGVLLLNAVLGSAQFLLGYFLLRRLFGTGQMVAIASSLVAALYPGVLLVQSYEYSDNLFRVVLLGCVIAAGLYLQRVSIWRGLLLGILASLAYTVHPRGLGVVAITAVVLLATAFDRRRVGSATAGLTILVVTTLGLRVLNRALIDAMYRFDDRSVTGLLSRLLSADFWLEIPVRAGGQLWYLSVATAGLFPVGVAVAAIGAGKGLRALRARARPAVADATSLYLLVASTVLGAIAVIFMTPDDQRLRRLDHLIYGRYNDAFVVILVMLAVAYLIQVGLKAGLPEHGERTRIVLGSFVVIGATAAVLGTLGAASLASGRPFAPISALGISGYVEAEGTIPLLAATVGGVVLAALSMVLAPRISKWAPVPLLCLAFVGFAFVAEDRVLRQYNEYWMNLLTLDDTIRYVGSPEVMGYDEAELSLHGLNGYQFWLDNTDFELFDSETGEAPPDVDLLVASETWEQAETWGARLIAIEPRLDQGLWVLPGQVQDDLERAGYLLASDPSTQLPAEAMASEIEIVDGLESGDTVMIGESRAIRATVRHAGTGSPWIPLGAWTESPTEGAVRLVARWLPAGETDVAALQIAELPRTLMPGEKAVVDLELSPAWSGNPLAPGEYTIRIGLVQEGVAWFEDLGDPQLDLQIRVTSDA